MRQDKNCDGQQKRKIKISQSKEEMEMKMGSKQNCKEKRQEGM